MPVQFARIPTRPGAGEQQRVIEQMQDAMERDRDTLNAEPIRDCRLLEDVRLTGNVLNLVPHGLGRIVKGYIITRQNTFCWTAWPEGPNSQRDWPPFSSSGSTGGAGGDIPRLDEEPDLTKYLPIVSMCDVSADILVF